MSYRTLNNYNQTYDYKKKSELLKDCLNDTDYWTGPSLGSCHILPPCYTCNNLDCIPSKQVCIPDAFGNTHSCKKGNNWADSQGNNGECTIENGNYSAGCVKNFGCNAEVCPPGSCYGGGTLHTTPSSFSSCSSNC